MIAAFTAHPKRSFDKVGLVVIGLWAAMLLIMIANAGRVIPFKSSPGQTLAGIDNYLIPLASIILAGHWLASHRSPRRLLDSVAAGIVIGTAASAIFASVGLWTDITPVGRVFWGSLDTATDSGSQKSIDMYSFGRIVGFFAQPAESGAAYGLGILSCVYLMERCHSHPIYRWLTTIAFGLLTLGGILAVSKIFLFIALPVAVGLLLSRRDASARRSIFLALGAVTLFRFASPVTNDWEGTKRIEGLLSGGNGEFITYYTAGRFGSNSQILELVEYVLRTSPWFGYGASGLNRPQDSAVAEIMVVGGLVGLILLISILTLVCYTLFQSRPGRSPEIRRLGIATFILIVGASAGVPALTANRVSGPLWILLTVIAFARWPVPTPPAIPARLTHNKAW